MVLESGIFSVFHITYFVIIAPNVSISLGTRVINSNSDSDLIQKKKSFRPEGVWNLKLFPKQSYFL